MSYDIDLLDPITRETLMLPEPHHMRGGTYAVGGSREASLNVTYNYVEHFHRVFDPVSPPPQDAPQWMRERGIVEGIRTIYGMTGAQSIPVLERAISMLGDDVDENYWRPTEGNAKRALTQIQALARMRPDGVWAGD